MEMLSCPIQSPALSCQMQPGNLDWPLEPMPCVEDKHPLLQRVIYRPLKQ